MILILIKGFVPMKNIYFSALRFNKYLRHQLCKDNSNGERYSYAIQTVIEYKEIVKVKESKLEASDLG